MKYNNILSLLLLTSYKFVNAYNDCAVGNCLVITVEDGISWGAEKNEWCIINPENCDKSNEDYNCFSFPNYKCCKDCQVVYEDEDGKWGYENDEWCGMKSSCFEPKPVEEKEKFCVNPIIKDMYTADPAPMVYGDTLYLYTTHDEDVLKNNFYTMENWYVFSTKDMVNWTNHGQILSLDDIEWADERAWAPQTVEKDGKFYFYFPAHKIDGGMAIGVAVADSPIGPFKEIGHPIVYEDDWNDFDPTVFIDDDGKAYLYFGNPELRYVVLNDDMISYDEEIGVVKVPMTEESFGKGGHDTGTSYAEGPYFYKRNGLYYMVYAAFREGSHTESLAYSTSEKPTGPWKYGGVIMTEGTAFTNHPGITDFNGKSYFFYHTDELPGGGDFHRSVCVTEFEYKEDGSIETIPMCPQEAKPVETKPTETEAAEAKPTETQAVESPVVEDKEKFCVNPIIKDMYTADPAPMVYGDTLYLYTTHDEDVLKNNFYTMENWYVFSTKDMVNWTNHGQILSLDDIEWADERAWAPQTVEKDGKFYFYFPAHKIDGGMAIGVAVADSPIGPFKEIGHPIVYEDDWNDFDPTVFIDDDGKAYLYFGNPELRYVVLNDDMISYDEEIGVVKVPMTAESFGKNGDRTTYGEGPYFYKRNGLYYMVFAAFREGAFTESLGYATSEKPTGPWKYGGVLMTEGTAFTNHPGIADFNGKSYFFYHTDELPGGGDFHRSVCVTEFEYKEDGSIETIPMCPQEAKPVETKPTETEAAEAKPTETQAVESPVVEDKEKFCVNPIIKDMYTADPAPMVYGDTLYLYTTHDEDVLKNNFYTMENWYVFSTKDMVNWTNHGQILSLDDIEWADERAWAPQTVEKDGKFYFYFPAHKIDGGMAIGVAVADSPIGPFKEIGHPIVYENDWNDFDPTVFIDDDGKAYLYFGNPELRYVVLNDDMISYDEEIGVVKVPMTEESFGKGSHDTGTSYAEGPYFYKRNGLYYMVYAAFREGSHTESLAYSTSEKPTGPWKYGGVLMTEGTAFTNHPGITDFNGKSYFFYHTDELPGGGDFHRSVCVTEFEYKEDGSIETIPMCPQETKPVETKPTETEAAEAKPTETQAVESPVVENKDKFCVNPIIKDMYTADPAPMVYGDTLYLYTTHDEDVLKNNFYTMENWYVFSTKDMVNWTNHGQILSLDDIEWADERAWAPQTVEKDGKFYFYFPAHKIDGGMAIGVAVADSPIGPFKEIGHPIVYEDDWNDFDPTVFIDDDGKAYLYFGNPELRYVVLNDDMISYDEEIGVVKVPMTEESFGKGSHDTGTSYAEGPYFYKRNGLYYLVYAAFREGSQTESLAYATSEKPTGPWKYGGVLMTEGTAFTNHPGIADFNGKSYFFYHTDELPGGGDFHRSVCVTEFEYKDDGSIDTIPMCARE
ncbi:Arabinanase/levansucrase/invertase [Neocallimastix lanati (nom. inval.)]|nr:Arabinanase/levansucrase/invertase [Neocallimastix sp. JGI-2020a]